MDDELLLVADDDADIRALIQLILEGAGYRTCPADSGTAALAAAHAERPRLAVLDVRMPGLTGLEVCRQVKADRAGAPVAVLMMSAETSPTSVAEALAAGADAYIAKPFSSRELLRRVRALLAERPAC